MIPANGNGKLLHIENLVLHFKTAAQVEGLVARMIAELGVPASDVRVVSTGYLAPLVVGECGCFTDHAPWLTLQGLGMVFARNARLS